MTQAAIAIDAVVGNGAAINVELGWIPDFVQLFNDTDGDKITEAFLGHVGVSIPFSSGGTKVIAAGDTIKGATSGATAKINRVEVQSGTFAAGNAAGFFIVDSRDISGTFTSESVFVSSDSEAGADDATVTANVTITTSIDTEVAGETTTSMLTVYPGDATHSPGFTIGSVVAEEAKVLRYVAMRRTQASIHVTGS